MQSGCDSLKQKTTQPAFLTTVINRRTSSHCLSSRMDNGHLQTDNKEKGQRRVKNLRISSFVSSRAQTRTQIRCADQMHYLQLRFMDWADGDSDWPFIRGFPASQEINWLRMWRSFEFPFSSPLGSYWNFSLFFLRDGHEAKDCLRS